SVGGSSRHEDFSIREQDAGGFPAGVVHRTGDSPAACGRIIQLGTLEEGLAAKTSGGEDFAVRQQSRRSLLARDVQAAGQLPGSAHRIVKLRAVDKIEEPVEASGDKHLSVGERNSKVTRARGGQSPGRAPVFRWT